MLLDAVNSSTAGLIIMDMDGIIRFANSSFCKMFDYLSSEITGKNAAELFSSRKIQKFSDVMAMLDISNNDTEEFTVETRDGRHFIVEVAASNVTSVSGEILGRMASFINITRRKEIEADREKLVRELQDALDNIKVLKGIIPICASCKKIRDDKGYWKQIESYIKEHSNADFSHSVCPECARKLYPEFYK
jgi:PAS domain S-box-containing protein